MGFELIASCENGKQAMEVIGKTPPDLVLTDIYMPYVDGIGLARYIHEHCPDTRTIIISGYDEFEYARAGGALSGDGVHPEAGYSRGADRGAGEGAHQPG